MTMIEIAILKIILAVIVEEMISDKVNLSRIMANTAAKWKK